MNDLQTKDTLTQLLKSADDSCPASASPLPDIRQLQARAASRKRTRTAGVAVAVACCAIVTTASLLPRSVTPPAVTHDGLASFRMAMAQVDGLLEESRDYMETSDADSLHMQSLMAAILLDEAQREYEETTAELAELAEWEASESTESFVDKALVAEYESAVLRLEIARTYEKYDDVSSAVAGYERLIASQPGTTWADEAAGRLAVLRL
jgi:hypothetical protein